MSVQPIHETPVFFPLFSKLFWQRLAVNVKSLEGSWHNSAFQSNDCKCLCCPLGCVNSILRWLTEFSEFKTLLPTLRGLWKLLSSVDLCARNCVDTARGGIHAIPYPQISTCKWTGPVNVTSKLKQPQAFGWQSSSTKLQHETPAFFLPLLQSPSVLAAAWSQRLLRIYGLHHIPSSTAQKSPLWCREIPWWTTNAKYASDKMQSMRVLSMWVTTRKTSAHNTHVASNKRATGNSWDCIVCTGTVLCAFLGLYCVHLFCIYTYSVV